jgi:hypothetical protein
MAEDDSTDGKNGERRGVQLARALNNLVADLGADLELDDREVADGGATGQSTKGRKSVLEDLTGGNNWPRARVDSGSPEIKPVARQPDDKQLDVEQLEPNEEQPDSASLSSLEELMAETTVLSDESRALIEKEFFDLAASVPSSPEQFEDMVSPQQMLGLTSIPLDIQERQAEKNAAVEQCGAALIISLEGDHHIRYPIRRGEITLGRSSENDIQINSEFISRVHARIVMSDSGAEIIDTCSRNGVVFGTHPVLRHSFRDGDVVILGTTRITYRAGKR